MIDVAAALRAPAPIPDPLEPNDDVGWATTLSPASLAARLDASEDPRDVYRVELAPGSSLRAELRSHRAVEVELWDASTPTVSATGDVRAAHLLASGRRSRSREIATTVNPSGAASTVFVRIRLRPGVERASYALWLRVDAP